MIVYSEPKVRFQADVAANRIAERIGKLLREKARRSVGPAEARSWENSMLYVRNVLDDDEIPGDAQVSIEYTIPQTAKRIDVISHASRCNFVSGCCRAKTSYASRATACARSGRGAGTCLRHVAATARASSSLSSRPR